MAQTVDMGDFPSFIGAGIQFTFYLKRAPYSMEEKKMATQATASAKEPDWTKPAAMAIPKEGYFKLQNGRYGPVYPKTPACYGFTIIAKIKPGSEEDIREYGRTIEKTVAGFAGRS